MTEIRFYHLERTALDAALPRMLEKVLERGQRAVVQSTSPERISALNHHLWVFDDRSFLPHGSAEDGAASDQPVWLTAKDENPNGAEVAFMADGAEPSSFDAYALVVLLFDGGDEAAVARAREQWKRLRDEGHDLTYWRQTGKGWEKKA